MHLIGLVILGLAQAVAVAAPVDDERAALAQRREAVERQFEAERAACRQRFAFTTCDEQARLRRRDALVALRREEAALDRRVRQAANARRRQATVQGETPLAPSTEIMASEPASSPGRAAGSGIPPGGDPRPRAATLRVDTPDRSADERRARAAFERRQREAQAHRREVEQRNAARDAKGLKPAAPLPAPASAASR